MYPRNLRQIQPAEPLFVGSFGASGNYQAPAPGNPVRAVPERTGAFRNETYLDHLSEGNFLFDKALEVCRELSQKAALYLATNGVTRVQKKRLRDSAIAPYIRGIFVSEEAGAEKPSPVYFDHVMKRLGNPGKEQILMVGDSLTSDMAGGIAAGIDTCWYNPRRKPLPPSLKVTWQIHSLEQLLPPSVER